MLKAAPFFICNFVAACEDASPMGSGTEFSKPFQARRRRTLPFLGIVFSFGLLRPNLPSFPRISLLTFTDLGSLLSHSKVITEPIRGVVYCGSKDAALHLPGFLTWSLLRRLNLSFPVLVLQIAQSRPYLHTLRPNLGFTYTLGALPGPQKYAK